MYKWRAHLSLYISHMYVCGCNREVSVYVCHHAYDMGPALVAVVRGGCFTVGPLWKGFTAICTSRLHVTQRQRALV